MKLNCIKCAAEIPAENMNLNRMVAKCAVCNSVFGFGGEFGGRVGVRSQPFDVPQPERVKVEERNGSLTIRLPWFTYKILFMTLVAIFWNGIMLSLMGGAFFSLLTQGPSEFSIFLVMPHFWIGLAMIYYVLTGYLNETRVTVGNGRLTVRHGPLPFWGNKEVATSDILQLFTRHNFTTLRYNWGGHYELHAITGKNRREKLLSGWENPDYALFVEQEVENFLEIEDYPVRGEYGRV